MIGRPSIITPAHLTLLAVIYIRQSSLRQVIEHTGSTAVQRALADVALAWGYPESHILIIDGDLGRSASIPGKRQGFRQLIELIQANKVGCVFLEDVSRMSRNWREAAEFIDAIMEHSVPVYYSGRLFSADEEALGELLGLQVEVVVAQHDQQRRTLKMKKARAAKVLAGNAVSPPPVGYVTEMRGKWRKDRDEGVQLVIRLIFALYLEFRSARLVALELIRRGLSLPRRRNGTLGWEAPSGLRVVRLLKNANYTPDYFYGRTIDRVGAGDGRRRIVVRPEKEWLVARDHHEGYVTREEFATVQTILRRNRSCDQGPTRGGSALLATLLTCHCGREIRTAYWRRVGGKRRPDYVCRLLEDLAAMIGLPRRRYCFSIKADALDEAVVSCVVDALTGPGPEDIRAVIKEAAARERDVAITQSAQLQAAEAIVRDLQRRYLAVNPDNDLVRVDLENRLQDAILRRDELRRLPSAIPPSTLSPADIDVLIQLAGNVREIWSAPTTTDKDRQAILRAVLARVVIASATRERVALDVMWKGGFVDRVDVVRLKGVGGVVAELRGDGASVVSIARQLADRGIRGQAGKQLTPGSVYRHVHARGLHRRVSWRDAAQSIRDLVLAGLDAPAIVTELSAKGPRHYRGQWTVPIVRAWILKLRRGSYRGIEQLPVSPCSDNAALRLMHRWHRDGLSWPQIADELNRLGYRRPRGKPFTQGSCTRTYHEWRRRGWLDRLLRTKGSALSCPLKRYLAEAAKARQRRNGSDQTDA